MGLDITYVAGEKEFSFCLPPTDVEVMQALAQKGFKQEVEVIIGVSDFDKESPVEKTLLLKAIVRLLDTIKVNPKILPYIFQLEKQVSSNIGMLRSVSGMISGIRIKGELFALEAGVNKCELVRMLQDETGNWYDDIPRDVRNLKIIETENMGEIVIRKRRKPTFLIRNLKELKTFLSKNNVDIIRKLLG